MVAGAYETRHTTVQCVAETVNAVSTAVSCSARGSTQGSWRPRGLMVVASPAAFTVRCSLNTVAVGLNAMASSMGMALEIPPWIPPLWLVSVAMPPASRVMARTDTSRFVRPSTT